MSGLTDKQRAFVHHYLMCWNASEAARLAGYSTKTAGEIGYENLKKPEIAAAIAARLTELQMSADEVLVRLSEQARASLADFIDVLPSGGPDQAGNMIEAKAIASGWRLNLAKAEQCGKLHLIKKIKSGQWGPEIELYDAQAAQALIGKHHALFTDKVEQSGEVKLHVVYGTDRQTSEPT